MTNLKKYIIYSSLTLFFLLIGSTFFLVQRNWLIVQWTLGSFEQEEIANQTKQDVVLRKKVDLYYWKDDKFFSEETTFIWFANKAENLKHLINNWLSFLHEERITEKKVSLETVFLAESDQQAYFSFDQSPMEKEWSTFKKWHFIESMFKTIRQSGLNIKYVVFLVGHQQMEDDHLDFSQPWPVDGFLDEIQIF